MYGRGGREDSLVQVFPCFWRTVVRGGIVSWDDCRWELSGLIRPSTTHQRPFWAINMRWWDNTLLPQKTRRPQWSHSPDELNVFHW